MILLTQFWVGLSWVWVEVQVYCQLVQQICLENMSIHEQENFQSGQFVSEVKFSALFALVGQFSFSKNQVLFPARAGLPQLYMSLFMQDLEKHLQKQRQPTTSTISLLTLLSK